MTGSRAWGVAAAAVAVLVGVVVWVRADSGATLSDLVTAPTPAAELSSLEDPLVIGPDGVPGVRFGMTSQDLAQWVGTPVPVEGCRTAEVEAWGNGATFVDVWLVDEVVAGVRVSTVELAGGPVLDVVNEAGPGLGSDIGRASELPGASTTVHRPFGRSGPEVSVVVVPDGPNDVVYTNAPPPRVVRPGQEVGDGITSIELRTPAARACSAETMLLAARADADRPVLQPDGVPAARLGDPLVGLLARPDVQEVEASPDGRCRRLALGTSFELDVMVVDEVVTAVRAGTGNTTGLGVSAGDGVPEVRAAFPTLDGVPDERLVGDVDVEGEDGAPTVRLHLGPGEVWLPDVETPVKGGPVVLAVSVLTPGSPDDVEDCRPVGP